ncbi:uncharacterized protein LOC130448390 [Diorhabda sublineata]|uniref:uncharacterized protein LOC130448390 n=1 Tax=Diorhabda sublineata TaxID=1163346 RepID=UPI0024E18194|nr:uncharacterized protein LOC130448390 [Diorhabda sublineata]
MNSSNIESDGGPLPNQIIEITGGPKVEKTDLLIDFIVKCILPNKRPEWKSSGAVLILCEHQINMFKIIKVIETHLKKNNVADPTKDILKTCLKNLSIFNCYSAEELDLTIMSLERFILAKDDISLIVIDNITSYYWLAKLNCNMLSYYQHAMKIFQKVYSAIRNLNVLLIYGRSDKINNGNKKGFQNIDYRIDIQDGENECLKACLMDFEKEKMINVNLRKDIILEFI